MRNKERLERYWLRFKENNKLNKETYQEDRLWVSDWIAANLDFNRDLKISKWMMPKNYKEYVKKLKSYYGDRRGGCPMSDCGLNDEFVRKNKKILDKNRRRAQGVMA